MSAVPDPFGALHDVSVEDAMGEPLPDVSEGEAAILNAVLQLGTQVANLSARLASLEGLLEEYRPLLEAARDRMGKQSTWRGMFAGGSNHGQ